MARSLKELSKQFMTQRRSLLAYTFALVQDHDVAEDLVQEVYVQLAEASEAGLKIDHFGKWCRGVARNLALKYWRNQRRGREVFGSDVVEMLDLAFEEQQQQVQEWDRKKQALARCIAQLPRSGRHILKLKYVEGRGVRQIAGRLHRSSGAIFQALSRLRKALLKCIQARLVKAEA